MSVLSALPFPRFRRDRASVVAPLPVPDTVGARPAFDLSAQLGADAWSRLPADVQRRFGPGHAANTYTGRLTLRCSPAGRVFAAAARLFGRPLLGFSARALPAVVKVYADDRGDMVWERFVQPPGGGAPQVVRSVKTVGAHGGVVERTDGGLGMSLDVVEEHGALVFRSHAYWLALGRWRLPLPMLLSPGVCRVAHTDLGHGLFDFTLDFHHPVWGHTFHQSGVFVDPFAGRDDAGSVGEGSAR